MKFAVDQSKSSIATVDQSREALGAIAAHASEGDAYGAIRRAEAKRLAVIDPSVLFHDDLAPFNQAFYFHEFVKRTDAAGLRSSSAACAASGRG